MIKLNLDLEAKSFSLEITNPTPFTIRYQNGNTRPPYLPPEKSVCRSRSNRLDMEQETGSKLGAINTGEGVEKREPSYTVGGNAH